MSGCKLVVRVEATKERKQWLTAFFNNTRAIKKTLGAEYASIVLELRSFEVYHGDFPHTALGKLNAATQEFVYTEDVLTRIGTTEEAIRIHLATN